MKSDPRDFCVVAIIGLVCLIPFVLVGAFMICGAIFHHLPYVPPARSDQMNQELSGIAPPDGPEVMISVQICASTRRQGLWRGPLICTATKTLPAEEVNGVVYSITDTDIGITFYRDGFSAPYSVREEPQFSRLCLSNYYHYYSPKAQGYQVTGGAYYCGHDKIRGFNDRYVGKSLLAAAQSGVGGVF